jgi:hypothetical protein
MVGLLSDLRKLVDAVEVGEGLSDTLAHGDLTGTDPDTRVVEPGWRITLADILEGCSMKRNKKNLLLVGLVSTVGVADLAGKVVLLADHVVADTLGVGELHVSVDVDLDDTVGDGVLELLLGGAGATVEDKSDGLVVLEALLLLDVLLVLLEELRAELDVTRLVDTVNVTEAGGDGEVGRDGVKSLVDLVDVFGLGVEGVVVNGLVVNTVLLATGDTDLHLDPLLHGSDTLEVRSGGVDVVVDLLLGKVNHVGGEQGLAVDLEVLLVGVNHAIEPGKELLGAVVGVKDHGDAVGRGDGTDVVGTSNGTGNGGLLVGVGDALTGEVGGTAVGHLEDDGRLGIAGSLERGDNGGGRGHVDGRNGKLLLLGVLEKSLDIVADDNTGLAGEDGLGHCGWLCGCVWY